MGDSIWKKVGNILGTPESMLTGAVVGTRNLFGQSDQRGAAVRRIYKDLQKASAADPGNEELKQRVQSVEPYLHSTDDIGNPFAGIAKGVKGNLNPGQYLFERNSTKLEPGGKGLSGGDKALMFGSNLLADPLTWATGLMPAGALAKVGESGKAGKALESFLTTEKLAKDAPKLQKVAQLGRQMGQGMLMAGGDPAMGLMLGTGVRGFERHILPQLGARMIEGATKEMMTGGRGAAAEAKVRGFPETSKPTTASTPTGVAEEALGTGVAGENAMAQEVAPTIKAKIRDRIRAKVNESLNAPDTGAGLGNEPVVTPPASGDFGPSMADTGPPTDAQRAASFENFKNRRAAANGATPVTPEQQAIAHANGVEKLQNLISGDPYAKTIGAEPVAPPTQPVNPPTQLPPPIPDVAPQAPPPLPSPSRRTPFDPNASVDPLQSSARRRLNANDPAITPDTMPDPFIAPGPQAPQQAPQAQFKPLYQAPDPITAQNAAMAPQDVRAGYMNGPAAPITPPGFVGPQMPNDMGLGQYGPPLPGDMGLGQYGPTTAPNVPKPQPFMGGNLGGAAPLGPPTQSSIQQLAAPVPAAQQARPGTALHQIGTTNFNSGVPPEILNQLVRSVAGGNTKANLANTIDIDPLLAKKILDALQGAGNTKAFNILSKTLKPKV